MPRLSFPMTQALRDAATAFAGRSSQVSRWRLSTIRALKQRGLLVFDDARGLFRVTPDGERALEEHGYDKDGRWLGSNQPRKYA